MGSNHISTSLFFSLFRGLNCFSGTTESVTLTEEQIPKHSHSVDGGQFVVGGPNGTDAQIVSPGGHAYKNYGYTSPIGNSQPHAHPLAGSVGNNSSLPPFYSLALIMRIS